MKLSFHRRLFPVSFYGILLATLLSPSVFAEEFDVMEKVNTAHNEFAPSINHDGKFMLFNSKRGNDKYMDIYISYFKNGAWSSPVKFDILNSPYNDETPFISRDGNTIVFSSDRDGSRELKLRGQKTLVSYDLYWSHKVDGAWSVPRLVPGHINTGDHERAPALSGDNKTLYFSRWGAGKMENATIMFSNFADDIFEKAQPMPREINSGNKELALVPDENETGFYFSSAREGGLGGWDIFYVSANNGRLGLPVNIGGPVNSTFSEAFFSILNGRIYYCSDRSRNGADYDILQGFLPGEKRIYFKVADTDGQPVISQAELQNIFGARIPEIAKHKTDRDGYFSVAIPDDLESIDLFIEQKGFLPYYRKLEKSDWMNPEIDIVLTPVRNNTSFSIEAIHFDYEKAVVKPESFSYLDRLANYLKNNPDMKLEVIGHTDLHGGDGYNLDLSRQRALAVKEYLVDRGISDSRFLIRGMGKSNPILNETSDHADKLNRRTEFRVIENTGEPGP